MGAFPIDPINLNSVNYINLKFRLVKVECRWIKLIIDSSIIYGKVNRNGLVHNWF